jgi:hypothetical protein
MNWKYQLTRTEYGHDPLPIYLPISNRLRGLIGIAHAEQMERALIRKKQLLFVTILLIIILV